MTQVDSPVVSPEFPQTEDLQAVDELAAASARILESVWSMKRFGRMSATYATFDLDLDTKLVKRLAWPGLVLWWLRLPFYPIRGWWRSFVLRPAVSIYTETHQQQRVETERQVDQGATKKD